eukprot:scaffold4087_cov172-Chaetoceros_neogracile.AAC.2
MMIHNTQSHRPSWTTRKHLIIGLVLLAASVSLYINVSQYINTVAFSQFATHHEDDIKALASDGDIDQEEERVFEEERKQEAVAADHVADATPDVQLQHRHAFLESPDLSITKTTDTDTKPPIPENGDKPLLKAIDFIIAEKEEAMQNCSIRFYMYDHPNITQEVSITEIKKKYWKAHFKEALNDESIFTVLKKSPLRTMNPDEADVFVPAIPFSRITNSKELNRFSLALDTLEKDEIFRKHYGHKHVLIGTLFLLFRLDVEISVLHDLNKRIATSFTNVTLAQSWDTNAVAKALRDGYDFNEYTQPFKKMYSKALTHSCISLGLAAQVSSTIVPLPEYVNVPSKNFFPERLLEEDALPLRIASMEKWQNSSNFIFYQSRPGTYVHNSTIYRHAPITNVTMSNLPNSKIGFGINSRHEWAKEYIDSKFCLNIRGDSPHSHTNIRSIRVGCIPVIVADSLPVYSSIMKSVLNMSDYAIFLDEKKFVENPEKEMLSLLELSETEIEAKLKHLAFAQRVILMDHPNSLFVPAFLDNAISAFNSVDLSEETYA